MASKAPNITRDEVDAMFGHRLMVETFAAHEARSIDTEDACLAERALCIATPAGLTQCGRTAHKTLPCCKLSGTAQEDICPECYGQMRQVVQDIKDGVRVL